MNTTTTAAYLATPKQTGLISNLLADRVVPAALMASAIAPGLSMKGASAVIDSLFSCPKKLGESKSEPAAPGYYLVDGVVFCVVKGKESGKLYAKKLSVINGHGRWDYAPGMVFKLTPAQGLSLEDATEMGKLLGCCVVCGRTLTDPVSVTAGIGPVCAKKLHF